MSLWNRLVLSALYRLDPEEAHHWAVWAMEHGLSGRFASPNDPVLQTSVFGLDFPNPVGLAAGFDKDARAFEGALALGFGFVEAGTVTPKPQPGNPRPRLFRLDADRAVINRFGFNSRGLEAFRARLAARKGMGIVGANVGKNKTTEDAAADYVIGVAALAPLADYLVVNLSSPNTPGLRALQAKAPIAELLMRVLAAREEACLKMERRPPLLAKVGPDLTEQDMADIAEVALETGIDGLIIGNTTITRPDSLTALHKTETGGLSGEPLLPLSLQCLKGMHRLCGRRIPIIGCGGIATGEDAYARIRAGASLVQFYSALVFDGPPLVSRIVRELGELLRRDGFKSVSEAVGVDNRTH
jgi:dihydroorotate dehydrogenase